MDETLPDHQAITVPVPSVNITVEDKFKSFLLSDITHVVVQLSDKRLDSIMQSVCGISYDFNKPWPFWFFIGKIMSKAFYGNEQQLEWLNAVRVGTREFIAFTNTQDNRDVDKTEGFSKHTMIQVVEVDFSKPRLGADLDLFWKPARKIITQKVQNCT
ncbi:uncharacterized protein N7518_002935 [Penicillium psychrosexuale]|uniref:uncharacterized protein n=1 Tax=Penicillium psychrosexuale TaxID=1002107 RepID=UPI002544FE8A|nr:uncharacterized protein N7518_002935 [Penicillium psychrosexuale]KAJ5800867.1 hypothetical protein N7518_002935 [Penicillium psychrosexuale]